MSLGSEIVSMVLAYGRNRLEELRNQALADAATFARALGIAGFTDATGTVTGHLTAAKAALDQAQADLTNTQLLAAANQLGIAVDRLDQAARIVLGTPPADPSPLEALLRSAIGWAAVTPAGLARQLGLPATVPGLALRDGALSYTLTGPSAQLSASPLTLKLARSKLTAQLRTDGQRPALAVSVVLDDLELGVGGGVVRSLLGDAAGSATADVTVVVDSDRGLTLAGSPGGRMVLPARTAAGPLTIREVAVELPGGAPAAIDLGAAFAIELGPIRATVDGAGVRARIDEGAIRAGNNPISVEAKNPSGIGLALDAGIVRGGGFLAVRPGGYGGALQLKVGPVDVKAVGLLTLEPEFALVVVLSIEFSPAIDLSFGFTLNGVGGVIGIEHRLDTDALRARLSDGSLDHLMFPKDPVAAAPAILNTLAAVFPPDAGSIVIGPMIEIGWGRPVSFLTARVGVLISLPDPKIVIIGRVRIALPLPELPIIDLRASVYGEITPGYLVIRVSLQGSRIAGFIVSGDIGLLIKWGGGAEFAVSAGGFHPRYTPPKQLAGMQRLQLDISPPAILTLRAQAYFALTSNSVQLGARVELGADLGVASISGYLAFDALIVFAPKFLFLIDLGIGLTVRAFGVTLCGVAIQLHLEGPSPWRAEGSAEVEILFWSVEIDVGPFTWGEDDNPPPLPADPRELVWQALHRNPGSWQALTPPDADQVVRLRPAEPSDTEVTVHPLGLFEVRQHAVPLETVVKRVGPNPVPDDRQRVHLGLPTVNAEPASGVSAVTDLFAAGSFLDLTDDQKLSRPAFEPMPAGLRVRPPEDSTRLTAARQAELRYETFIGDPDTTVFAKSRLQASTTYLTSVAESALFAGAAGRSELRAASRYATAPDPIVLADPGESRVRSTASLAAASPVLGYTAATERVAAGQQVTRLGVG